MKKLYFSIFYLMICYIGLLSTAGASSYRNEVLSDNPLGYWELDETSGGIAIDSSGNGNNGSYIGGISQGNLGAFSGSNSVQFNGVNGYVDLGSIWTSSNELTIEAWANVSVLTGGFQALVSSLTASEFAHLQFSDTGDIVTYSDAGTLTFGNISQNPINDWRHIALVATSGNSKVYLDGVEVASNSSAFASVSGASSIHIGNGYAGGRFFNGFIDDVAIYEHALSASDINRHLAATTTTVPAPSAVWLLGSGLIGLVGRRKKLVRLSKKHA